MIRINLLPYHLRPIKRTPVPYILSGLVLILVLLGLAGLWLNGQRQISAKEGILAAHQREYDGLKAIVDEHNKLTEQKLLLADKVAIIQEIISDRIIWSQQLFNVSRLTPDNFWYKTISEEEKPSREMKMVYNEKTKKEELKSVTVKHRMLVLTGYVIEGPDGSNDINPITFRTEQDPEFSALFPLSSPKLVDSEFNGYKVRSFTLEYLILKGAETQ